MAIRTPPMTVEAFEQFVDLPENADRMFELINGEIVEVPSNPQSSNYGARFIVKIGAFTDAHNRGELTGEHGGYLVDGQPYAPDVAFVSNHKLPLAETGYNPTPPDLVVEVVSSGSKQELADLRAKIVHYLNAGVVVWAAFPKTKIVEVHVPGQPMQQLGIDDTLDGGDVLPGFTLPLRAVFR